MESNNIYKNDNTSQAIRVYPKHIFKNQCDSPY